MRGWWVGDEVMNPLVQLTEKIEQAGVLDEPAAKAKQVADGVIASDALDALLRGEWLGHPAHPLLVIVPIGSYVAASAFDLMRDTDAARRLIGLGLLATPPAVAAGIADWRKTPDGAARRVGMVHAASNAVASVMYLSSFVARKRGRNGLGAVLALAGATAMSAGGYLGGHLAYENAVGVQGEYPKTFQ